MEVTTDDGQRYEGAVLHATDTFVDVATDTAQWGVAKVRWDQVRLLRRADGAPVEGEKPRVMLEPADEEDDEDEALPEEAEAWYLPVRPGVRVTAMANGWGSSATVIDVCPTGPFVLFDNDREPNEECPELLVGVRWGNIEIFADGEGKRPRAVRESDLREQLIAGGPDEEAGRWEEPAEDPRADTGAWWIPMRMGTECELYRTEGKRPLVEIIGGSRTHAQVRVAGTGKIVAAEWADLRVSCRPDAGAITAYRWPGTAGEGEG